MVLFLMALLTRAVPAAGQVAIDVPPTEDLRVTVYQGTGALLSDRRRVTLEAGANVLRIPGIPTTIREGSLDLQVISGPQVRPLDRERTPGAGTLRSGLRALIGQQVSLVHRGTGGGPPETTDGTLLEVSDKGEIAALRVGDRVVLYPDGEVEVSDEQLAALHQPPLVLWRVESPEAGEAELLLTYLIDEGNWDAGYTVALGADGTGMNLASEAEIHIDGTGGLGVAGLRLVSGSFAAATGTNAFAVDRPVTFPEAGRLRASLANVRDVPVRSLLLFDGGTLEALADGKAASGAVVRVMRFENSADAGLGTPLPQGDAVVYQAAGNATARLITQTTMPASADGDTIDLRLGEVGGLQGTSRQESWRQLSPEDIERKCAIQIANKTGAAHTVTCGVTMSGNWEISDATHEYARRPDNRVEFAVPVGADEKAVVLKYTVRIKVPSARTAPASGTEEAPPVPADEGAEPRPSPG